MGKLFGIIFLWMALQLIIIGFMMACKELRHND